jgi:hemerythrin-like domain-containing protein
MVVDHALIRGLVMTLIEEDRLGEVGTATLVEIGERLEAHIRLEERHVFPLVETALPEVGLKEIEERLGTE